MNPGSAEDADLSWWSRLGLAVAGIVIGLGALGAGFQLMDWGMHGGTEVTVTVSCGDTHAYYEDAGRTVERYRDESGTWCTRTTEEDEAALTAAWPLWLAAPAWVGGAAVTLLLVFGGICLAVYAPAVAIDRRERTRLLRKMRKR